MFKAQTEVSGITIHLGDFRNEATRDRVLEIYESFFGLSGRWSTELTQQIKFGISIRGVEQYAQQAILDSLLLGDSKC